MRNLSPILAALVLTASSGGALAQPLTDWTGVYIGISGGHGWGHQDVEVSTDPPSPLDGLAFDYDIEGWLIGLTGGANVQMDGLVLGVEGDISWTNITGSFTVVIPPFEPSVVTGNIDWLGTLRGRAGVAVDSLLLYGTAGLAVGGLSGSITDFPSDGVVALEGTQWGWTAGFGGEVAVNDNVSFKAEYLYVDLGSADYELGPDGFGGDATATVATTAHIVRGGVNVSF